MPERVLTQACHKYIIKERLRSPPTKFVDIAEELAKRINRDVKSDCVSKFYRDYTKKTTNESTN